MFSNVLPPKALALLTALMQEPALAQYRLVGGTALALLRGHRISVDLDLFMEGRQQPDSVIALLREKYVGKEMAVGDDKAVVSAIVQGVKVDLVAYPYPWLAAPVNKAAFRLAALDDISAMKVAAIGQRGTKKDFFDIGELLDVFSLAQILSFFRRKFPSANDFHYIQSLTYFADAEREPDPAKTERSLSWAEVKLRVTEAVRGLAEAGT